MAVKMVGLEERRLRIRRKMSKSTGRLGRAGSPVWDAGGERVGKRVWVVLSRALGAQGNLSPFGREERSLESLSRAGAFRKATLVTQQHCWGGRGQFRVAVGTVR